VQLNVHDLNNEAVAGNVTDIRIMEFIDEIGNRVEARSDSNEEVRRRRYGSNGIIFHSISVQQANFTIQGDRGILLGTFFLSTACLSITF